MSGGGEIVFVPVAVPLLAGAGIVLVAVSATVATAYLADLGADAGIEAIRLMVQIGDRMVEHLGAEYDAAVRERESHSLDELRREIVTRSAQKEQADRALQAVERTRTRLSGSRTADLLRAKAAQVIELATTAESPDLLARAATLGADALGGPPQEMVKRLAALQIELIGQLQAKAAAVERAKDPVVQREQKLREVLIRSERAMRVTLSDPFVSDDEREATLKRLDELLARAETNGLFTTIRTIRTLEENVVRSARESAVAELRYRRAYARASAAVKNMQDVAVADPLAQVAGHTLQMQLEALAERAATAAEVEAIAARADREREAALKRAQTLQLAAVAQSRVAEALREQGCGVHYVAQQGSAGDEEPWIVAVDDHVGIKITFEQDSERQAVTAHTEMVAFDEQHARADDITQRRVCNFVEELARRMDAQGFAPQGVEAGHALEVVERPGGPSDEEARGRHQNTLNKLRTMSLRS